MIKTDVDDPFAEEAADGTPVRKAAVRTFTFLLFPRYSMVCFACAIEPLRIANRMLGREAYRWRLVTRNGEDAVASNGIAFPVHHSIQDEREMIRTGDAPDYVIVIASLGFENFHDPATVSWLRALDKQGICVSAASNGAWILADAGLLDGTRCCIHWESIPAFTERFPEVSAFPGIFEFDGKHYTCAGGTASLDMMMHLIQKDYGKELVRKVAEQVLAERQRSSSERQKLPMRARLNINNSKMLFIIELMEANVSEPLSLVEIASYAQLSRRQIERLFLHYLGRTPARYYMEIRLDRARQLLIYTSMSMLDIAIACGFISASHFSKSYRSVYQRSPQQDRRELAQAMS